MTEGKKQTVKLVTNNKGLTVLYLKEIDKTIPVNEKKAKILEKKGIPHQITDLRKKENRKDKELEELKKLHRQAENEMAKKNTDKVEKLREKAYEKYEELLDKGYNKEELNRVTRA